jgi:hypothetical protein
MDLVAKTLSLPAFKNCVQKALRKDRLSSLHPLITKQFRGFDDHSANKVEEAK